MTYTIEVTNSGPSAVTGVTLTDVFPSGVTGVTWTCAESSGAVCASPGGNDTIATSLTLPVGGKATITATGTVAATAPGPVQNTATIAAPAGVTVVTPSATSASATFTVPESPRVGLAKRVANITDNGDGSSSVVFEVTAGNLGNVPLNNIAVSDDLATTFAGAAGFTVVPAAFVGGNGITANPAFNGRTDPHVATISSLGVGSSATLRFGFRVQRGGNNGPFNNSATATGQAPSGATTTDRSTTGTNPDPNGDQQPGEQEPTPVLFTPNADLAVAVLAVSPKQGLVGQDLTYTVTVTNHGPAQAAGATLTQTFGTNVAFVSGTGPSASCTGSATTVTCALGNLNSGDSRTLTIVVRPTATPSLNAAARATTTTPDPVATNNERSLSVKVEPSADLALTKSVAPTTPSVGQTVTSTLTVTNNGPSPATNVLVTDQMLGAVNFVSATPNGACTATGTTVRCTIASLAVGSNAVVTTTFAVDGTGSITDIGAVTANEHDPVPANNGRTVSVTSSASADLSLTKTASTTSTTVGQQITYQLVVRNAGPSPAENVTVRDALPTRASLASASSTQGGCSGKDIVSCDLGTLASGGSATVTIVVDVEKAGALPNVAAVSSTVDDPNPGNNTADASTTASGVADLAVTLSPPAVVLPEGSVATFTATITNNGPQAATSTAIRIGAANSTGLSALPAAGTCTVSGIIIDCDLGVLGSGASTTVTIDIQAGNSGVVFVAAAVQAFEPDPATANNIAVATATVGAVSGQPVNLGLTKTGPGAANGGANVPYSLTVTNPSINTANNVVVEDVLPGGFVLVSTNPSQGTCASPQTGRVRCELGAIAGLGGTATIGIVAQADAAGVQVNTATVTSDEPDTDPSNNLAQVTTTVASNADVSVTVAANPAAVTVGEQVALTFTVSNAGPTAATGVELSTLLSGVAFDVASATPSQGTCASGTSVPCELGTLASGGSATVTVVGRPRAAGDLFASGSVTSGSTDPDATNNAASTAVSVSASADLAVTLTAAPDPLPVTGNLTYVATVTNRGPSPATDVLVLGGLDRVAAFVSATPSQGDCRPVAGLLLCAIGNLASGASATISVVVREDEVGVLVGGVAVAANEPDPDPSNNGAAVPVRVVQASVVGTDLALTKTASRTTAEAGAEVRFDLVVHNRGTVDATGVVVTDPLPAGLAFVSATTSQGTCTAAQTISCSLGTIASNSRATITVTTRAATPGTATNTATVRATETETDQSNNTATATVAVSDTAGVAISPGDDDTEDTGRPLTETQRQQRQRSNASGLDDERTEGEVMAVRCSAGPIDDPVGWMDDGKDTPYVVIANRDGLQKVRLWKDARSACDWIRVGQYLTATGQKESEQLFNAEDVDAD